MKYLVMLALAIIPIILVINGQYWAIILIPAALALAEVVARRLFHRSVGYRMAANERAKVRRWQSKIDSEATAKHDPGYWDRRRAYNEQVGLAVPNSVGQSAPNPPASPHDLTSRLAQLDAAKAAGQLTDAEYTKRRAEIIAST
jgi:hypothetical protein